MKLQIPEAEEIEGVVAEIGSLPPGAILTEQALAKIFSRSRRTVKRAVRRRELPPPSRLFGENRWTAGAIINHIEDRIQAADAEKRAERQELDEKIDNLRPANAGRSSA